MRGTCSNKWERIQMLDIVEHLWGGSKAWKKLQDLTNIFPLDDAQLRRLPQQVHNKHSVEVNISFLSVCSLKVFMALKHFCCLTSRQEDSGEDPFSTEGNSFIFPVRKWKETYRELMCQRSPFFHQKRRKKMTSTWKFICPPKKKKKR